MSGGDRGSYRITCEHPDCGYSTSANKKSRNCPECFKNERGEVNQWGKAWLEAKANAPVVETAITESDEGGDHELPTFQTEPVTKRRRLRKKTAAADATMEYEADKALQADAEDSRTGDSHQLWAALSDLQSKVKTIELTLQKNPGGNQMHELRNTVAELQSLVASKDRFQDTYGKFSTNPVQDMKGEFSRIWTQMDAHDRAVQASEENLQKLKGAVSNMQVHVSNMEIAVQEKAGSEQMHQLSTTVAEAKSTLVTMAQHKADANALQQLQDSFTALQLKMPSPERVQQLESTVTDLGKHVNVMEQGKADKGAHQEHCKQLADQATQVKTLEAGQADLISHGRTVVAQCRQINRNLEELEARVEKDLGNNQMYWVSEAVLELQQVIQKKVQLSGMDNSLRAKADLSEVQPLGDAMKVGNNEMQQLIDKLSDVEAKQSRLEQALQEKAPACQMQQLKNSLSDVQAKVFGVVQASASSSSSEVVQLEAKQASQLELSSGQASTSAQLQAARHLRDTALELESGVLQVCDLKSATGTGADSESKRRKTFGGPSPPRPASPPPVVERNFGAAPPVTCASPPVC